ncbi:MAG: peptidylprolyl isomerase [Planctomycetota bacterium]|nr:peptidylprolyl isomerase [Planctomycetota bacterium]
MYKIVLPLTLGLLLIGGCGDDKPRYTDAQLALMPQPQRENLPIASGGLVLAVNGETITADEIVNPMIDHFREYAQSTEAEEFRAHVRPQVDKALVSKISNILLYQQAKNNAGDKIEDALEKAADSEVAKFIVSFNGNYAKAEEALKEMGMDWTSFKDYQKKMILSQSYLHEKLPDEKPITYNEVLVCYNDMKDKSFTSPAKLKFRLIDLEISSVELTDPNQNRQEYVKKLAVELIRQLNEGSDFGELAKKYSKDHRASAGGLWDSVDPESLAKPYDVLGTEADKIEPGQLAVPIEAQGHIFIMKLDEKKPKSVEPLEKVQKQIEAKITFDRRKKAIDEFGLKLAERAAVAEKDAFIDFCTDKLYKMANE